LGGALRNLAIKFAMLTSQITAKKPDSEAYLDLAPLDMLKLYKACLSREQRSVLLFAFSDNALLAIAGHHGRGVRAGGGSPPVAVP
jgi:hypothetical protein